MRGSESGRPPGEALLLLAAIRCAEAGERMDPELLNRIRTGLTKPPSPRGRWRSPVPISAGRLRRGRLRLEPLLVRPVCGNHAGGTIRGDPRR